ncbi:MAG TPA: class I SAM-dependent methyltransferase [Thermoplasmata archaeon]|nr:class I SAM-dependent methyltransferase [Thermoplasmata archaeon]
MVEVVRHSRRAPAFGIIRERDHLNRMFLEQLHREDYRHRTAIDIGTGTGRVVWEIAPRAHRVIGVDKDERRLMDARAYAGIRGFGRVSFIRGDAETTAWNAWHPEPFDFVTAHLCMSEAIIFRASRHLRPDGKLILGTHHKDQWRENGRGSGHSFTEDEIRDLIVENGFELEFLGVDTTIVECADLVDAERVLGPTLVRKWVGDGRWEGLADSFEAGTRQITLSLIVAKARKLAHGPVSD